MTTKEDEWIEFEEKMKKLKRDALSYYLSGDYDGAYNIFKEMNELLPPKYRAKLERFRTGYE